jgi:CheY-like chemotaxis protein
VKPFRVLIVEDDYLFAAEMQEDIIEEFERGTAEVEIVPTEAEFEKRFPRGSDPGPVGVIVLDIMIRWSDPESPEPKSEEAEMQGYYTAGIRCLKRLRSIERTRNVDVIIHSNLDQETTQKKLDEAGVDQSRLKIVPKSGARKPLLSALRAVTSKKV